MGCIEMTVVYKPVQPENRLIETWDVLKFFLDLISIWGYLINRNMGCIEICLIHPVFSLCSLINRNMGCIEIKEI